MGSFCATVNEHLAVRYVNDVQDIVYRRNILSAIGVTAKNS